MNFVDFHIHAGKFSLLRDDIQGLLTKFPFEEGVDVREIFSEPLALKTYLQERGVVRAVILAECGPGTNFSIDSQLILEFCGSDPFFVPFGNINPLHHADPLQEWHKDFERGIKGYKFYPADHGFDPYLDSMMAVYEKCAEVGQPIMFHTGLTAQRDTEQKFIRPGDFRRLVETFPTLKVIFAHGGKPTWYDEALEMACRYPGVYLDTALVPPEVLVDWLHERPEVHGKVLFGSDLPVCGSYSAVCQKILGAGFNSELLQAVLSGNANQVLAA
ncbi:amidohydrolase family protein [Pseudomonas sp. 1152_12]|uniref:amidohydrolase family protein n=1 Tax=Pseudomonas sp. 1152_12 TaxID=2604455 RepID=UPI004062E1BB